MERFKQILITIIFIAFLIFVMTLSGCKVIERVEYVTKTDTVVLVDHKIDSAYVKDSIYIYSNADTVFYIKWKEKVKYLVKTDTIFKASTDTLIQNNEIIKEVEKKRPTRDILAILGVVSLFSFVCFILYKLKS